MKSIVLRSFTFSSSLYPIENISTNLKKKYILHEKKKIAIRKELFCLFLRKYSFISYPLLCFIFLWIENSVNSKLIKQVWLDTFLKIVRYYVDCLFLLERFKKIFPLKDCDQNRLFKGHIIFWFLCTKVSFSLFKIQLYNLLQKKKWIVRRYTCIDELADSISEKPAGIIL